MGGSVFLPRLKRGDDDGRTTPRRYRRITFLSSQIRVGWVVCRRTGGRSGPGSRREQKTQTIPTLQVWERRKDGPGWGGLEEETFSFSGPSRLGTSWDGKGEDDGPGADGGPRRGKSETQNPPSTKSGGEREELPTGVRR